MRSMARDKAGQTLEFGHADPCFRPHILVPQKGPGGAYSAGVDFAIAKSGIKATGLVGTLAVASKPLIPPF